MLKSLCVQLNESLKKYHLCLSSDQKLNHDWPSEKPVSYWTILQDASCLLISGKDAVSFLQGQLTCDVMTSVENQAIYGACCNPKGRMIANFHLIKLKADCFALLLPLGQADILQAALKKYSVFYQVTFSTEFKWMRLGVSVHVNALKSILTPMRDEIQLISLSETYSECWVLPEDFDHLISKLITHYTTVPTVYWQYEILKQGIAWVMPEQSEHYVPQAFNWDLLGGISFTKGCYTGQEIVARLHYRGVSKTRLQYFTSPKEIRQGDFIRSAEQETIQGQVMTACYVQDTHITHILASVRLDQTNWMMMNNQTILLHHTLPYAL
ncbi:MAG: folate-binding protein YgfZ [Endozoicomonadaceae bacterium]|nr:folate-binding protein YgfZ [Endozoicomonadaceae bacterium]MBE8232677.1 folate-binding protein YgfZ [Endozoicomonadaceae bacterium]